MPFDAAKPNIVELDYDFRPHVNASGRTPEPTEDMIYEFQDELQAIIEETTGEKVERDKAATAIGRLTREQRKQNNARMFAALAKLTQGRPSYEEMMALSAASYRLGQAYLGSIIGDILNPKGE